VHDRGLRRFQAVTHMWRRLNEDRNQHYNDLTCPCWTDKKRMARFKEQPKPDLHCYCCVNPRRVAKGVDKFTMQERRLSQQLEETT